MLAAEAAAAATVAVAGSIGVALTSGSGFRVAGVPLTAALTAVMLAIAAGAAAAMICRRAAKLFSGGISAARWR